jgi:hypothetical protein
MNWDVEQSIARMFDIFGIPRDEVVITVRRLFYPAQGYWTEPGHSDQPEMPSLSDEKATIGISSALTEGDMMTFLATLAHELQHHSQWRSGRLAFSSDLSTRKVMAFWDGQFCSAETSSYLRYRNLPWEVEARFAEEEMVYRYISKFNSFSLSIGA